MTHKWQTRGYILENILEFSSALLGRRIIRLPQHKEYLNKQVKDKSGHENFISLKMTIIKYFKKYQYVTSLVKLKFSETINGDNNLTLSLLELTRLTQTDHMSWDEAGQAGKSHKVTAGWHSI